MSQATYTGMFFATVGLLFFYVNLWFMRHLAIRRMGGVANRGNGFAIYGGACITSLVSIGWIRQFDLVVLGVLTTLSLLVAVAAAFASFKELQLARREGAILDVRSKIAIEGINIVMSILFIVAIYSLTS